MQTILILIECKQMAHPFIWVMFPDFIVIWGEPLSDHYSALLINCITLSSQLSLKMLRRLLLYGCSKILSEVKWHFFFIWELNKGNISEEVAAASYLFLLNLSSPMISWTLALRQGCQFRSLSFQSNLISLSYQWTFIEGILDHSSNFLTSDLKDEDFRYDTFVFYRI